MKHLFVSLGMAAGLFLSSVSLANTPTELPSFDAPHAPISLRENITVSSPYIRLNDLFNNVTDDIGDTAIAYAPKPGRRASFDAKWLFRVARAYNLDWRPLSANLAVHATRDSIIIGKNEILDALHEALSLHNLPENPMIDLSNRNLRVHVPSDIMPLVTVDEVAFNQRSKRFSAIVSIADAKPDAASIERVRITGQVHNMVHVPTLKKSLQKGEVISEDDIHWMTMREDRIQRNGVTDISSLIGKATKRRLSAEKLISANDVQDPILVEKGSIVTILLRKPGISLSAQGRAMEHGSDGETIRIVNTNTSRTIEAKVVGSGTVTVQTTRPSAQLAYNQ